MTVEFNVSGLEQRLAGLVTFGLNAAGRYLADRVREAVNVQAPLRRAVSRKGKPTLRAGTKARAGSPPRRVGGTLYRSVAYKADTAARVVRITVASYGAALEHHGHPFLGPTLRKYGEEAARRAVRAAGA